MEDHSNLNSQISFRGDGICPLEMALSRYKLDSKSANNGGPNVMIWWRQNIPFSANGEHHDVSYSASDSVEDDMLICPTSLRTSRRRIDTMPLKELSTPPVVYLRTNTYWAGT